MGFAFRVSLGTQKVSPYYFLIDIVMHKPKTLVPESFSPNRKSHITIPPSLVLKRCVLGTFCSARQ